MPEIVIKDINNKDAGKLALVEEKFGLGTNMGLMHSSVVNHLANQRQGTHATKNRALVSGGGAKPYRQKGTGRARAGSNTSPLWRGGGTIFGPTPRDYSYAMPKKARRKAFFEAISAKIAEGEVVAVDKIDISTPKTRRMVEILNALDLAGKSVLFVMKDMDAPVAMSARNIPTVRIKLAADINAYDVLSHDRVLITKEALESLQAEG